MSRRLQPKVPLCAKLHESLCALPYLSISGSGLLFCERLFLHNPEIIDLFAFH